jgi:putative Mg2+ transporter-C (MgtC) family protein
MGIPWVELLSDWLPLLGRLTMACLLGALIGFEREAHGQAAGFRTNIIVAMSACLIMEIALSLEYMYRLMGDESVVRLDPGRLPSYAMAGMGFLGAGAIIKGRGSVRGLTTAAGLWLVTAIGLAVGAGLYAEALFTTIISLLILYNIRRILRPLIAHDMHSLLTVRCKCPELRLRDIKEVLERFETLEVKAVNYYNEVSQGHVTYKLRLQSKESIPRGQIVTELVNLYGLESVYWEEADVP